MKRILQLALCLLVGGSTTVFGFDGNRKGFVLGGGLGIAPAITVSADLKASAPGGELTIYGLEDTRAGIGGHFLIGYAWDNHNMIVFELNSAAFEDNDVAVSQGFAGAAWYHYFGAPGHAAFTTVGLGLYGFDTDQTDAADSRGGMLLGGGYEFSPHWQFGGYLSFGRTSYGDDGLSLDLKHSTFSILISGVIF